MLCTRCAIDPGFPILFVARHLADGRCAQYGADQAMGPGQRLPVSLPLDRGQIDKIFQSAGHFPAATCVAGPFCGRHCASHIFRIPADHDPVSHVFPSDPQFVRDMQLPYRPRTRVEVLDLPQESPDRALHE